MKIIKLLCPSCGATIEVNMEGKIGSCQYCGSALFVDDVDERKEFVYRKIDEAKIKKAEYQADIRKTELAQASLRDKILFVLLGIYGLAVLAVIILSIIKSANGADDSKVFWFIVGMMITMPLMIFLTVTLAQKEAFKANQNPIKPFVILWIVYLVIAFVVYLLASDNQEVLELLIIIGVMIITMLPLIVLGSIGRKRR